MEIKELGIDIETKSGADLGAVGVYRYVEDPEWEIQLFGYSVNGGPVKQVDLTQGETIPPEMLCALTDPAVRKWAQNVSFERINLSRYLGRGYIDPEGWYCTMVMCAYNGLAQSLSEAGKMLRLEDQKMEEGKELVHFFSMPRRPTKGNPSRWNRPSDAPDKWALYKAYNVRDVEVEDKLRQLLPAPPEHIWTEYWDNERMNDRGVLIDRTLVDSAIKMDVLSKDAEGHKRGVASNHGDPEHLWAQLGLPYTMDGFREEVKRTVEKAKLDNVPTGWAEEAVAWAVKGGIITGDEHGDLMLRSPLTREQFCVMLKRYHDSVAN